MTKTDWIAFLDRLDRKYVGQIYKALRIQYEAFADDFKQYGPRYATDKLTYNYLNAGLANPILEIHSRAGRIMAASTLSELNKQKDEKRGFGYNEDWVRQIQQYFATESFKSVSRISETTRKRLVEVLSKAAEEGWGVEKTVRALKNLEEIRGRAKMIVRTETVRAANYGTFLGADKFDYEVEKEWIAVHDNRTRHTHRNVDEEKKKPYDKFSNGLLFPGDPEGPASEVINCRCTMAWKAIRDSNGRLVPKKSPVTVGVNGLIQAIQLAANE